MTNRPIGLIGLGRMGSGIGANILRAGLPLHVHALHRESARELENLGARWAPAPAEMIGHCEVVVLSLPDDAAVQAVTAQLAAAIPAKDVRLTIVDTTTTAPETARSVAAFLQPRGVAYLDAPVSGGQEGAAAGTLSVMVGGGEAELDQVRPIIETFAGTVVHCGPGGSGQVVKACNQLVVGMAIGAVAEMYALAQASGVDMRTARAALLGGYAASRVLELHGQHMIDADFEPRGRLALFLKDLRITDALIKDVGIDLPLTAQMIDRFEHLASVAGGTVDHAALWLLYNEMSNGSRTPAEQVEGTR